MYLFGRAACACANTVQLYIFPPLFSAFIRDVVIYFARINYVCNAVICECGRTWPPSLSPPPGQQQSVRMWSTVGDK